MTFKKEIEQSLEQIRTLEEHFRHARNSEILPISFFSASYDIVRELASTLHHIEQGQLKFMQEQFIANEISFLETTGLISDPKSVEICTEAGNNTEEISEEQLKDSFFPESLPEDLKEETEEAKKEVNSKYEDVKVLADSRKYTSLNDKFSNRFS